MTILLKNLSLRRPRLNDARAVATLLATCDASEDGYTEEEILTTWQQPGFVLASDAWLIVTHSGQYVAYASLTHNQHSHLHLRASVHPHYRGRGIGTLLLRLAEVRARQRIKCVPPEVRVTLTNAVNDSNHVAKALLEHEGYTFIKHFWRIAIETEEDLPPSHAQHKHKLVLDVKRPCVTETIRIYEPSGLYTVRQYALYEKELRAGKGVDMEDENNEQHTTPSLHYSLTYSG